MGSTNNEQRVHVIADVDSQTRDWAATLPETNAASAAWDRAYRYAWLRKPNVPRGTGIIPQHLKPVQIIRIAEGPRRDELARTAPTYLNVQFVTPPERASAPMRPVDPRSRS
jgi:hypothetical protein